MDRVDRRSALASLALHGLLVGGSLVALGGPPPPPRPQPAPPRVPTAPSAQPAPTPLAPLGIPVEDAVVRMPSRLPTLGPGALPPPPLPVVRHRASDFPGKQASQGRAKSGSAAVDLPELPSEQSAPATENGQRSSAALREELRRINDAAGFLTIAIENQYRAAWRGYATQMTNRDLVIQVEVDPRGIVVSGGRFAGSTTGCTQLDEAIDRWLATTGIRLPRIPSGVAHYFAVRLP
jgi:hypothetical protein